MPKTKAVKRKVSLPQKYILPAIFVFAVALSFGVTQIFASSSNDTKVQACKAGETCVSLLATKADPAAISVINGTYVQFNSADGKSHQLTLGDEGSAGHAQHGGKFDSNVFKSDEAYRVKFTKDGAYVFKDKLNPKISVVVVVYTPGKDYTITR